MENSNNNIYGHYITDLRVKCFELATKYEPLEFKLAIEKSNELFKYFLTENYEEIKSKNW